MSPFITEVATRVKLLPGGKALLYASRARGYVQFLAWIRVLVSAEGEVGLCL